MESKILGKRFGKRSDNFLKAPQLEREEPEMPDPNERPKTYVSNDLWVFELYSKLEALMANAVKPLNAYIEKFKFL